MSTDLRDAAAAALGIPSATPDAAIGAFLQSLPGDEFVPSPERIAAVNVLALAAAPVDPDTALGPAAAVEDFVQRFWTLPPAERREEWAALDAGARTGPIVERIAALRAGLDVTADPVPDAAAEEVAGIARALFTLPARARAVRRNEWLLAAAARHAELVRGAAALGHLAPASARLDPQLMHRLSTAFDARAFATTAAEGTLEGFVERDPVETARSWYGDAPPTDDLIRATSTQRAPAPAAEGSGCGVSWAVIVVVVAIARGLLSLSSNRTPDPTPAPIKSPPTESFRPPPQPEFQRQPESRPRPNSPSETVYLSGPQIAACEKFDLGTTQIRPLRYDDWVRCGRPSRAGWHEMPLTTPPARP